VSLNSVSPTPAKGSTVGLGSKVGLGRLVLVAGNQAVAEAAGAAGVSDGRLAAEGLGETSEASSAFGAGLGCGAQAETPRVNSNSVGVRTFQGLIEKMG